MNEYEKYLPYFVLTGAFVMVLYGVKMFVVAFIKRDQKAEIENSEQVEYQEICGARFDIYNLTYPFVRLALYDTFLILSYTENVILKYKNILSIKSQRHIFGKGLHLNHNSYGAPRGIIIWSRNIRKLEKILNHKIIKYK